MNMKRSRTIMTTGLAMVLALSLMGCGNKEPEVTTQEPEEVVEIEEVTDEVPATEEPEQEEIYYASSDITVRSTDSLDGEELGIITMGEEVTAIGVEGDWTVIEYNGQTGYVSSEYLTTEAPMIEKPEVCYAKTDVNIRSAKDASSSKLGQLKAGQEIQIVSVDGEWTEVLFNGSPAYIMNKYLSTEKPVITADSETKSDEAKTKTTTKTGETAKTETTKTAETAKTETAQETGSNSGSTSSNNSGSTGTTNNQPTPSTPAPAPSQPAESTAAPSTPAPNQPAEQPSQPTPAPEPTQPVPSNPPSGVPEHNLPVLNNGEARTVTPEEDAAMRAAQAAAEEAERQAQIAAAEAARQAEADAINKAQQDLIDSLPRDEYGNIIWN